MRAAYLVPGVLAAMAAGCSASSAADAGDAGGFADGGPDGGADGGCALTGASCDPVLNPCCSTSDQCLLIMLSGLTCSGSDAGPPDAGPPDAGGDAGIEDAGADAGPSDAGSSDGGDGGPDAGPSLWVLQSIPSDVTTLFGLAAPTPGFVLAAGRNSDGGLLLQGSGTPDASFVEIPGLPASIVLTGVWSDPTTAVVLAVGRSSLGEALFEGSLLDGGSFQSIAAQWTALALLQCWGDGLGNLYAVGLNSSVGLVLFEPVAGSFAPETLPAGLATVFRITGATGGTAVYALAVDNISAAQILARVGGAWTELSGVPTGVHLADLALEADGTLVVVGDDGFGGGLGYLYSPDGGTLTSLPLPSTPFVPKLHAVVVASSGELYLGAGGSEPGNPATPFVLRGTDGGWTQELLPSSMSTLNQLADDGAGSIYAVGTAGSVGALLKRAP
jgi:hypothetical protein